MENIVEEAVCRTDMDPACAVVSGVRKWAHGAMPAVASAIVVTARVAFRNQLIEIKVIAKA